MLIADGGGGTAWSAMSMDDMQRLIQNPDIEKHYDLVGGWQKSAELVNSHLFQVQSYRDNLAAVWPPKQSPASEAYLTRLDELIGHLTETYNAALANHDALAAATLSLSLAQHDVQKLYDEYQANQGLLQAFETRKQEAAASPTPHPTPSPSGEQPPVAPGRQEQLRQRAAALLGGVSTDLAQAQMSLVRPRPYEPANKIEEERRPNDGSTFIAPLIPPFTSTAEGEHSSTPQSTKASPTFPTSGGLQQSETVPGVAAPSPANSSQPGLVLGGANAPAVIPPLTAIPPVSSTTPSVLPPGVINPITGPGATRPGRGTTPPGPGTVPPSEGALPGDSAVRPSPMPPGGIIGAAPGIGLSQPGGARPGLRRVNPTGGVIGEPWQGSTGSRTTAAHSSGGFTAAYGQPGRPLSSRAGEVMDTHWDPNNPWQTAEGVDPVVLPAREQRVDPGPAIGLS
ncbi:hypothetical protein HH310_04100 [Actinoplanes sp. TBRC 11911]|uniref:hypothetical protein n=1 Tax=Actinoplanes sp. TBRC 11911 TaxID=2729386 RepID=UPI00145E93C8|nr:hypothetical protein [Actinoplanes sp. TBRC 11911]NMO50374.1 hypothetical protein [Actinoplanes sp. TBRC 11911]